MDRYIFPRYTVVCNRPYKEGTSVTFDGDLVRIENDQYVGFRDKKGRIHVYTDEACAHSSVVDVTLHPSTLIGATIRKVKGMKSGSSEVVLKMDRRTLTMGHRQSCCESVELIDVCGDPDGLIGGIIGVFEVRVGTRTKMKKQRGWLSETTEDAVAWKEYTFYEIRTSRGDVTLRWGEPDNLDNNRYGEDITLTIS